MEFNKDHWYDGWFYDTFIAPNQDRMFREIKNVIQPNSSVIDIGCGTGRFPFSASDKVSKIIGVDVSRKNIDKAKQTLKKFPNEKISFHHSTLSDLISQNLHFDYAVMTYVIHEVNPNERVTLLKEMSQIADQIIIGDYQVPVQKGFWSVINEVVEYLAGNEHYNNFKDFVAKGGLMGLANKANLKVYSELNNTPVTSQLLIITSN